MSATATESDVVVALFGFELARTGLRPVDLHKPPSRQNWEQLGEYLKWMDGAIQWLIGDWINYGEAHFSEKAAQAVDATGWQLDTVQQCARVAAQVPPSRRSPDLSWTHHREVADLEPKAQTAALKLALDEDLSSHALRARLRKTKPEQSCWLVVSCKDESDRQRLQKRLELEGRACKVP